MSNNHQKIVCATYEQFFIAIQALVERGLTFTANTDTLIIELTGGY